MKRLFTTLVLSLVYLTAVDGAGWQDYIDKQLLASGKIKKAAIVGLDGNSWAKSANFELYNAEVLKIVALFEEPIKAYTNGVTVDFIKYSVTKADEQSIYGKYGTGGVILAKTKQAIVIGTYDAPVLPEQAAAVIQVLADYLINSGY